MCDQGDCCCAQEKDPEAGTDSGGSLMTLASTASR